MTGNAAPKVLVIGAGIAGLFAARDLAAAGARVVVVDKGRGVGGRLATRRIGGASLDHGAQFFTARSAAFSAEVAGWLASGVATDWFSGVLTGEGIDHDDGEVRYRGAPTMATVAKYLAQDLDVRTATRVDSIEVVEGRWHVGVEGGSALLADAVVVTAPVPQTLALFAPETLDAFDRVQLERIEYAPTLAVLAVLDRSPDIGPPGARRPSSEPVAWYADNQAKGVSAAPAITVHAGPRTSADLWDAEDDEVVATVLGHLDLGAASVVECQVHRWRYAQATVAHPDPALLLRTDAPAVTAGDAFGAGGRVEGAALSGMAAANRLAERLGLG
ncbi:MAG: FAD-dependent oxidoreductase [Acidimicrobiia bacterium]|nr:FAD-dependent oxidoreductase [Acidimicrobiia bacterium]